MDITSVVSTLKDGILGISALTGAFVAVRGLTTWDRQTKGQASCELARRLLRNTYALRNAILDMHYSLVYVLS